jgi:hypothetical protein
VSPICPQRGVARMRVGDPPADSSGVSRRPRRRPSRVPRSACSSGTGRKFGGPARLVLGAQTPPPAGRDVRRGLAGWLAPVPQGRVRSAPSGWRGVPRHRHNRHRQAPLAPPPFIAGARRRAAELPRL